jgi:hypothetical protein
LSNHTSSSSQVVVIDSVDSVPDLSTLRVVV